MLLQLHQHKLLLLQHKPLLLVIVQVILQIQLLKPHKKRKVNGTNSGTGLKKKKNHKKLLLPILQMKQLPIHLKLL